MRKPLVVTALLTPLFDVVLANAGAIEADTKVTTVIPAMIHFFMIQFSLLTVRVFRRPGYLGVES